MSAPTRIRPAYAERVSGGLDDGPSLSAHLHRHGPVGAVTLEEVDASGLLGRGGAGFPLGRKLRAVAAGDGPRVLVANGCEGEPGSAKDTLLLTGSPHLVLDGIQVAAGLAGADQAHLAVHDGSPAMPIVAAALRERRDPVPVTVVRAPRRYVASEESALVNLLNGGPALPAFTPPRPFERGVRRRPTLVSNVETLAQLALISRYGADWFREIGDVDEPGTQLLTVSGPGAVTPVRRAVLEVASGRTVGEVLRSAGVVPELCGAVLVGGYFGTWFDIAVAEPMRMTHADLRAAGGALGAGIVIGLPATSCGLAETARVATFLAQQGAQQCGPCLNGLPAIAQALTRLAHGPWNPALTPALDRWLDVVPGRGACRHPDGAVRLVRSALEVFAADVAAHRAGRPCTGVRTAPFLPLPAPLPARGSA